MAIPRALAKPGLNLTAIFDLPTRPEDIAKRHFNRMARAALREVLVEHHKLRIPQHFRQDARQKYGYAPRSAWYMRVKDKAFGSRRDLVKTGGSEEEMKRNPKITIGGSAEGGGKSLEGRLKMRFAFKGGAGRFRSASESKQVPIRQMIREVRGVLDVEQAEMAKSFRDKLLEKIGAFRGNRKRVRRPLT